MRFASGDAKGTVDFVFEMSESAPKALFHGPIMSAIKEVGDEDLEEQYYELAARLLPDEATVHGNRASFLLRVRRDAAGAIQSGERAIAINGYEMVRAATAAAYRLSAAEHRVAGDDKKAATLFETAQRLWSLPPTTFSGPKYCFELCSVVDDLRAEYQRSHPPAAPHR